MTDTTIHLKIFMTASTANANMTIIVWTWISPTFPGAKAAMTECAVLMIVLFAGQEISVAAFTFAIWRASEFRV